MEKYICQLIEKLLEVAQNPPAPAYLEPPPMFEDEPEITELAQVPFKTIEELTGIMEEEFPPMDSLVGDQWQRVNDAIFKVFESLKLELVDKPEDIPPECLYDALTTNWQAYVQYLPSSGMDLELCTGDPDSCPYWGYCDCDEEFDEFELPPHLEELVPGIAESIDAGMVCFINPDTSEVEEIPKMWIDDPFETESMTGELPDETTFKHYGWEWYYTIEPPDAYESFETMENFARSLEDNKMQDKLIRALSKPRPFANFKSIIDRSDNRQKWFDYKKSQLELYVKKTICSEMLSPDNKPDLEDGDLPF